LIGNPFLIANPIMTCVKTVKTIIDEWMMNHETHPLGTSDPIERANRHNKIIGDPCVKLPQMFSPIAPIHGVMRPMLVQAA